MPRGIFVHRPITATARIRGELTIGWAFHYAVGIIYAALYLMITTLSLGSGPTLFSAIAFGLVLLIAPWLVMQPALGLGIMASRAPKVWMIRAVNVSTHAAFGVGLYLGALMWDRAVM